MTIEKQLADALRDALEELNSRHPVPHDGMIAMANALAAYDARPAASDDVERVARAICAEKCAYMGEPACWSFRDETWPPPTCDEPGCVAEAMAAIAAMGERDAPQDGPKSVSADVMQQLYDSEINVSVSSFWDGGWQWQLGDDMNGFELAGTAEDWDSTVYELAETAATEYPDSVFKTWWVEAREIYWPKAPAPPASKG